MTVKLQYGILYQVTTDAFVLSWMNCWSQKIFGHLHLIEIYSQFLGGNALRTLITIALICLATTAFAGNRPALEATHKLDSTNIRLIEVDRSVDTEVVLGNLNDPVNEMADWAYGNEAYTYVINSDQVESCPGGFAPLSVSFYMTFEVEDLPMTFPIQGALRMSILDAAGNKIPGDRVLETPTYEVTLEEAGEYELIIPFDETTLTCVDGDGPWFGELYLPVSFPDGQLPGILADENPLPGTSFYNYFLLGWEDLVEAYSWTGGAVVRVNAACCEGSVPTESSTFGGMKSLYR